MEYVKPFKGSPRYHRWSIISVMAAVLERRVWFPMGGLSPIHPNLYVVLCGGPGTGKTTASNLACSFVKEYNKRQKGDGSRIQFGPDKVTPAALLNRFQKYTKQIKGVQGKLAFEQSAMYLHSTELSTLIKDIGGGSLSDDLLKLYDCDDYFEKEIVMKGTIKIPGPCLNFLGDTTPTFLSGFLPRQESGTGLTARIIFATEMGRVEMDEEVPEGDKVLYEEIVNEIGRMHRMCGRFQVDLRAKEWFSDWFKNHRDKLFDLHDGSYMRNFYARKPVHIRKVAMALSAGRSSNRVIMPEDYQRAVEFIEEAEPFMDKSFGVKEFRKVDDATKQILDQVPFEPSQLTKPALIQSLYSSGLSGSIVDLDNILKTLVDGKLINRSLEGAIEIYSRKALD